MTPQQIDLFADITAVSTSHIGLTVILPRECRYCHSTEFTIGSSKNFHCAVLACAACGQHGGWLSVETFSFIDGIIDRYGRPTSPIVVRASRR
jgi:hypothetical protein